MTVTLNKEQEKAARVQNGIFSVIAVPGSGKTLTMTHRIGHLVKNGVEPECILGLTFTKNASQAMKEKLQLILQDQAGRVQLSTIHSFCLRLLKVEGKNFEILFGKEQIAFIKKIMQQLNIKNISIGMVLREISLAKNNLISMAEFIELYEPDKTMCKISKIFCAYEDEKRKRMRLDFDDLLVETYKLLSENEAVREKYQEIFRHILVDEYQDTNPVQIEILKLLIDGSSINDSSFWACGDDWQSIYAFNGATVGNILNFKALFPDAIQFILNLNYRSTPQILTACQNLIRHNHRQINKTLNAVHSDGENVMVLESANEDAEAVCIADEIRDLTIRNQYHFKDVSVLYRANFQSRMLEEAFLQHKIPYHIENGLSFYDRTEVKVLLDYLKVITEPDSDQADEALVQILNVPTRYIGMKFITELEQFAEQNEMHLYPALKSINLSMPYLQNNINAFTRLMDQLIQSTEVLTPAEVIDILRSELDYDAFISDEDIPSPDDAKIANINQLQLSASKYSDISSFIKYTDSFSDVTSNDKDGVVLMTIHKAKGLEFPVVFIAGMVEGILPSKNGDMEEERRICFVGISRAMELLYLSHSQNYLGLPSKTSVFINEILNTTSPVPLQNVPHHDANNTR